MMDPEPTFLYKTEIKLLDNTVMDPTQFVLSILLDLFLVFFNFSSFFFLAMEALSLLEWNLSAHALMVAGSLEIPTKEQMTHICQPFRKILVQNKRQPQATSVLIFIGHHCCEFLRFLACFTLIYNEVLTCSLRGTQPVALIQKETCWLQ